MVYTFRSIYLLQIILCTFVVADKENSAIFTDLKCRNVDPIYVKFTYCRLKAINRTLRVLSVHAQFLQPPVTNAIVQVQCFKKSNGYKPFLLNMKFDFCAFLEGRKVNAFEPLYGMIRDFANINSGCPLPDKIMFDNLTIRTEMFPSLWPIGEFRFDVSLFSFNIIRSQVRIYFEVSVLEIVKDRKA